MSKKNIEMRIKEEDSGSTPAHIKEEESHSTPTHNPTHNGGGARVPDTTLIPVNTDKTSARNHHMRLRLRTKPLRVPSPEVGESLGEEVDYRSSSEPSDNCDSTPETQWQGRKRRLNVKKRKRASGGGSSHGSGERAPAPRRSARNTVIEPNPTHETREDGLLSHNTGIEAPLQPLNAPSFIKTVRTRVKRKIAPMPSRHRLPARAASRVVTPGNNQGTAASGVSQRDIAPSRNRRIPASTSNANRPGTQRATAPSPTDRAHNPDPPPPGAPANSPLAARGWPHRLRYENTPSLALCKPGESLTAALARLNVPPSHRSQI